MIKAVKKWLILILIVIAIFVIGSWYYLSPTTSDTYNTYQQAKANKLFDRGWLPNILPTTTTNITTHNNLDLNTSYGSFIIPINKLDNFVKKLTMVNGHYYYQTSDSRWQFDISFTTGKIEYELIYQK